MCFEVAPTGTKHIKLHAHGFAESEHPIKYNKLYREWGVSHKFRQLKPNKNNRIDKNWIIKQILYIIKNPLPFGAIALKVDNFYYSTRILVYWTPIIKQCQDENLIEHNDVEECTQAEEAITTMEDISQQLQKL